jgi:hypothetical protein
MRKLWIAALALAVVLALGGMAVAANTYKVHKVGTTVPGKGSLAHAIPTGITIGFQVRDSDPTKRATVIEKYALGIEGIRANGKGAPKCAFDDLNNPGPVPKKCSKARVGGGLVKNAAGASTDRSLEHSRPCNLDLDIYNLGTGLALHLDSHSLPAPSSFDSNAVGCDLKIDGRYTIKTRFVKTRIAGKPASDIRFTVPENLKHPLVGVDNSIRQAVTKINLETRRVAGKRVGLFSKVGCKGARRTTRVTFTTEQTATEAPHKAVATKTAKC